MSALGKKLRQGTDFISFKCPGCDSMHTIKTGPGGWEFNGDGDRPTFSPSVLVTWTQGFPPVTPGNFDEYKKAPWVQTKINIVCHSFVKDGHIQFLTDCTHALAGQTVSLPDLPGDDG